MVSSAEALLDEVGRTIDDVDVYVPHQANTRIIDYATKARNRRRSRDRERGQYRNTSSGSIPLALGDAEADGQLQKGSLVLAAGMGAGLTWGSTLMEWTANGRTTRAKVAFCFPRPGSLEGGDGPRDRLGRAGGDGGLSASAAKRLAST